MAYNSKYTGAEVDALLDKVAANDVISIDSALSTTSENPVQNKAIAKEFKRVDALEKIHKTLDVTVENLVKKKVDAMDYAPHLSVGVADNLSGVDVVASEFTSRQSGGGAILDGTARIEAIKGSSLVWNQLVKAPKFGIDPGTWFASAQLDVELLGNGEIYLKANGKSAIGNETCSPRVPLLSGHTYLYSFDIMRSVAARLGVYLGGQWWATGYDMSSPENAANVWRHVAQITTPKDSLDRGLWIYPWNNNTGTEGEAWLKNVVVYDLTQMFGAGNEPTTVEEFNKRIPIGVDPMLYNGGQMINLNPSGIESYSADEEPIKRFRDLSLIGTLFLDGMKSVGEHRDEIRYNKDTQKWEKIVWIGAKAYQDGDADNAEYFTDGQITYYILEQPIEEELEFDGNLDYQVWNGGTEEVVPYEGNSTTALKADIAYGFNAKGLITELRGRIEAMMAQMSQMQTSLTQMSMVNEE